MLKSYLQNIENFRQINDSKKFYRELKCIKNDFNPLLSICKDSNGDTLQKRCQVLQSFNEW